MRRRRFSYPTAIARIAGLAVVAAGLCALAACGSNDDTVATATGSHSSAATPSSPSAAVTAPAMPGGSAAPFSTNQPATRENQPQPANTRPTVAATNAPAGGAISAECGADVLRASVQALAPDLTTGVQQVKIYNCVSGYARLYATPNPAPNGTKLEGDQFFLQFSGGQWHILVRGAGVDCGDSNPKLVEACAAFDRS